MHTTHHLYKPFFVPSADRHSMGENLKQYLKIKIHHFIHEKEYSRVVVTGAYTRTAAISKYEKTDKVTNWQRPTAELKGDTLFIQCYPGTEYVRHYAALIASYFQVTGMKDPNCVSYELPTEEQCWKPIFETHLEEVPVSDWLILGSGLEAISQVNPTEWHKTDRYLWAQTRINSKSVTFLIFQHSFWGDILERLVIHLIELGHKRQVFTAKVGGIRPEHIPNQSLATGGMSFIEGEVVKWNNVFQNCEHPQLFKGDHFNSPSVLFEIDNWLDYMKSFHFVDSEIGHFARGVVRGGAEEMGYIHFISNRLCELYPEDLSNERLPKILEKRTQLKGAIREVLEQAIQ